MPTITISDTLFNRLQQECKTDESLESVINRCMDRAVSPPEQSSTRNHDFFYRALFNNMKAGVLIRDTNNRIIACNPRAEEILGIPRTTILRDGQLNNDLAVTTEDGQPLPEDDAPAAIAQRTGQPVHDVVGCITHPDGTDIWLSVSAYPVFGDDAQSPVAIISVFDDITESKQSIDDAHESAAYWRFMSDLAFDGLVILEQEQINDVNQRLCDILGYTRDEIIGKSLSDFVVNRWRTYPKKQADDASDLPDTYQVNHKDGHLLLVEVQERSLERDGKQLRVAAIRDVSQQHKARQELEKARALLHTAIDQSPTGILIADNPDLEIQVINQAALKISGYDVEQQPIPESLYDLGAWQTYYPNGDPYPVDELPLVRAVFGQTIENEEMLNDNGRWVSVNAAPVRNAEGNIIASVAIFSDITERKRTIQELEASEDRYRLMLENAPVGIFVLRLDADATIQYINPTGRRLFGVQDPTDIIGRSSNIFIPSDTREMLRQRRSQLRHGKATPNREYQLMRLDGTRFWVRGSSMPIPYNNEPSALVVITDVSERVEAENALRQERNLLRTLIDSLPHEVYVKDRDGKFLLFNQRVLDSWDLTEPEQLTGKTDFDLVESDWQDLAQVFHEQEQGILATGKPLINYEVPTTTSDGRYINVSKYPVRDANGNITRIVGVNYDVTSFKQTENALRESEDRYRRMLENAPVGIFVVRANADAHFRYLNPTALRLFGADKPEDLIGTSSLDLIPPDTLDIMRQRIGRLIDNQRTSIMEYVLLRIDGSRFWVRGSSIPIVYEGDPAAIVVITDIDDRKKAEDALRASEETAREFQGYLQNLHDITIELSQQATLEDIYRRAVDLGRSKLGIDRIGLWVIDNERGILCGTYGTGGDGTLRDERQETRILKDKTHELDIIQNKERVRIWQVDIRDGEHVQGRKWSEEMLSHTGWNAENTIWNAIAILWDGVDSIGWLTIDNAISLAAPRPYEASLLSAYGTAVGHIITQKQAENALRQSEETALDFQDKLHVLHEVSLELSLIDNMTDFYRRVIELGREALGFDRLGLWSLDKEKDVLRGTFGTDEAGNLRDERPIVRQLTDDIPGLKLINNKERVRIWENNTLRDNVHRAIGQGWNAIAVLWNGSEGIGWLTADNYLSQAPPRPYEADLLSAYGTTVGYLVTQKRSENALRESEETARAFQDKLQTLHDVTLELSLIDNMTDFYRRVVELGREALGFDRLGLWVLSEDGRTINGTYGTDEAGNLLDESHISQAFTDDFIGFRMIENKERFLMGHRNVIRDARGEVVGTEWTAIAILWNGNEGLGWLSTDNYTRQEPPRPYESDLLSAYCNVIGHLITQKRADEAIRKSEETALAFQEKLRTLHDVTLELSQLETFDDLHRRAIELGRERLGFDRLGLWLFDKAKDTIYGTFGTDEAGYLRDEREERHSFRDEFIGIRMIHNKERVTFTEGDVIRNHQHEMVGAGWSAIAVLWNGADSLGWLSTDNHIKNQSPRPYETDLLSAYSNVIGHLIARKRAEEVVRLSEATALAFQEKLRTLHDVTLELSQVDSFKNFYRRAIELGREALGFDRLGLWRVDEAKGIVSGTFGTDEQGDIQNESHVIYPLSESEEGLLNALRRKERIYMGENGQIYDEQHAVIGHGWSAVALIWDGVNGIGWLATDNHLSQAEPRPYEFDLLTIYANVLGNLIVQREAQERQQSLIDRLTILSQIDNAILHSESPETTTRNILSPLQELIGSAYVSITIVDEENHRLLRIAHTDTYDSSPETLSLDNVSPEDYEKFRQGGYSVFQQLPEADGEAARHLKTLGIRSAAVIPMMHSEDLLGLIIIGFKEINAIKDVHVTTTQQVATQLAIAMRQSLLYRQVQEYNEQLEAKVAERTIQLEEKARELEAFTYSVSHDLRAPLRAISGFSTLLNDFDDDALSGTSRHYLSRIHANTERMGHLIDDLLMLSRISRKELRKRTVDTRSLVQDIVHELEVDGQLGQAKIHIADLPSCKADASLLRQVYINLITNAVKYSRYVDTPTVHIDFEETDGQVTYFVRDNGVGFDMKYADKLFGVFQRLHNNSEYEGTGIGLATVHRIINRHDGTIRADAAVNEGATFFFTLGADEDTA